MAEPSARGRERREQLVSAGVACLLVDGWAGVTHRRVAAQAHATTGLVRYHFGDVAGLRAAIADDVCAALGLPVPPSTMDRREWIAELTTAVEALSERRDDAALLVQVMVGALAYPEVSAVVRKALASVRSDMAFALTLLEPPVPSEQAEDLAATIVGLLDGLLLGDLVLGGSSATSVGRVRSALEALLSPR